MPTPRASWRLEIALDAALVLVVGWLILAALPLLLDLARRATG